MPQIRRAKGKKAIGMNRFGVQNLRKRPLIFGGEELLSVCGPNINPLVSGCVNKITFGIRLSLGHVDTEDSTAGNIHTFQLEDSFAD